MEESGKKKNNNEAVDHALNEKFGQAIAKLQMLNSDSTGNIEHRAILAELKAK